MKRNPRTTNQPVPLMAAPQASSSNTSPETHTASSLGALQRMIHRLLGVMAIAFSAAVYVQLVPLAMVFTGGYLGIQPGSFKLDMDALIWLFTASAVVIPMVYIFIQWVKYLWTRFVVHPTPFRLFGSTRKKHA